MALIKHSQRTVRRACEQCGSKDLYWAHDSDGKRGSHYCAEHDSANFTLINLDGTRHDCQGKYAATGEAATAEPEATETGFWVSPTPTAPPVAAPTATDDRMGALAALLDLLAPKVDAAQVQAIIDDRLRGLVLPVRVEVTRNGETKPVEGLAHEILPAVIRRLARKRHVCLVGPAGTGKSHIVHQAADALGIPFGSISLTAQTPASAITGYMTATGQYAGTVFRDMYEHGGIFLFDEVDAAHPNVLGIVNSALANGTMAFPDGMVKRHDDFRCAATGNTYGRGPDRAYVGRQALDLAFTDRFTFITVEVDEALEESLCLATGLDGSRVKQVLRHIRYLRSQADAYKLPLGFGPRRSEALCDALADGFSVSEALDMEVRRGISDADWRKVSDGAPGI